MADSTQDDLSRAWWEAIGNGQLTFQRCAECDAAVFYPRQACNACLSERLTWEVSSGKGSVYSYSIVHRAPTQELRSIAPYPVVLVELDEGFRLLARAIDADRDGITVGQRMELGVETGDDGTFVPVFRPL